MRRLSGVTLELSTLDRGVASWISSLRATRVSRSRSQGSAWEQMTLDISGPTSPASSASASPRSAPSRTSPVTCLPEHAKSSESFKRWATTLRHHCGRRRKLALLTVESAFSSSLPTPSASSYGTNRGGAAGRTGAERPSLETMARKALFPTPSASHCEIRPGATFSAKSQATSCLGAMAKHDMFPTPLASDARRADLRWPTPTVKGNYNKVGLSARSGDGLSTAVGGGPLNPTWVEWLMGWPSEWSACGSSETASSPSAQKKPFSSASMRSELGAAE